MVTGTPKIRGIELIGSLKQARGGVSAGEIGRWGYVHESMNTRPELRMMMFKDGVVYYLQAGMIRRHIVSKLISCGGIVYDSDPY